MAVGTVGGTLRVHPGARLGLKLLGIERASGVEYARYLAEVLNVLRSPQVAIETSSSASPGVFKAVGRDDFVHVIMPMHVGK